MNRGRAYKAAAIYVLGLVTLPVIAVAAAFLGLFPTRATPSPPKWETSIAGRALDASLEHRASKVDGPIAADANGAQPGGDNIYDQHCSICHGDRHGPSSLGSQGLYPRAPQFFQGEAGDLEPKEAYVVVRDGIRYSAMPAWGTKLPDTEVRQVAAFVSGKSGKSGS